MPGAAQISTDDFLTACRAYLAAHSRAPAAAAAGAAGAAEGEALGARLYSRGWTLDESRAHLSPAFSFLHRALPVQVRLDALDQLQQGGDSLDEDWISGTADNDNDVTSAAPVLPRAGPVPDMSTLSVGTAAGPNGRDGGSGSTTPRPSSAPSNTEALRNPSTSAPVLATMSQSICYSPTWKVPVFYFSVYLSDGTPLTLEQVIRSSAVHHELDPLLERPGHLQRCAEQQQPQPTPVTTTSTTPGAGADLPATFAPISSTEHPVTGQPALFLHPCETAAWLETLLQPAVSRRGAWAALARTSSSSNSTTSSHSSHSHGAGAETQAGQGEKTPPTEGPSAAAGPRTASPTPAEEPRERMLCAYLETFVALVASAIEMRL